MAAPVPLPIRFMPGSHQHLGFEVPDRPRVLQFIAGTPISDSALFGTETQLDILFRKAQWLPGPFTLNYNSGTAVDIAEAQSADPFTADFLLAALNANDEIKTAGGLESCREVEPYLFEVRFRSVGSRTAIALGHPIHGAMTARVTEARAGDGSTKEIQRLDFRVRRLLRKDPGDFSAISAGSITVTVEEAGDTATAEITSIDLGELPAESGSWHISHDAGTTWSAAIPVKDLTAYRVHRELEGLSADTWRVDWLIPGRKLLVTNLAVGTSTDLQVNADAVIWPGGKQVTVDFGEVRRLAERYSRDRRALLRMELVTGADVSDSTSAVDPLFTADFSLALTGPDVAAPAVLSGV